MRKNRLRHFLEKENFESSTICLRLTRLVARNVKWWLPGWNKLSMFPLWAFSPSKASEGEKLFDWAIVGVQKSFLRISPVWKPEQKFPAQERSIQLLRESLKIHQFMRNECEISLKWRLSWRQRESDSNTFKWNFSNYCWVNSRRPGAIVACGIWFGWWNGR